MIKLVRKLDRIGGKIMISYVKGELIAIEEEKVIIEVNGVGFGIFMPGQAMGMLPAVGGEVRIHTYLHVKEDAMQLFGFLTRDDLKVFKLFNVPYTKLKNILKKTKKLFKTVKYKQNLKIRQIKYIFKKLGSLIED